MVMLDDVIIAAIREEYNAATPAANRSELGFWRFAAEYIAYAYWMYKDDAFLDWAHELVDNHARAILAHNPELSKDDDLMELYFDEWDFEA